MANYFIHISAQDTLTATPEEYAALKASLEGALDNSGGYEVHYLDGRVFVVGYFHEGDTYPPEFLRLLGKLIEKNGLPYLEFGEAFTCDRLRVGSNGGGYFRIRTDGSSWEPKITW